MTLAPRQGFLTPPLSSMKTFEETDWFEAVSWWSCPWCQPSSLAFSFEHQPLKAAWRRKQCRNWRQNQWGAFWIVEIVFSLRSYDIDWAATETEQFLQLVKQKRAFAHRPSWSLAQYSQIRRETEIEVWMGDRRADCGLLLSPHKPAVCVLTVPRP